MNGVPSHQPLQSGMGDQQELALRVEFASVLTSQQQYIADSFLHTPSPPCTYILPPSL